MIFIERLMHGWKHYTVTLNFFSRLWGFGNEIELSLLNIEVLKQPFKCCIQGQFVKLRMCKPHPLSLK